VVAEAAAVAGAGALGFWAGCAGTLTVSLRGECVLTVSATGHTGPVRQIGQKNA
jgi:hypothetical protein